MTDPVLLSYPFTGRWMASNSPARKVPSHGTHLYGTTYAIDFIGVDERGRSGRWGLRAALATEPPDRFVGFGRPILAPVAGTVVAVHDGEDDHVARRSLPAGVPYLLGQGRRLRGGAAAMAGNHVVIAASGSAPARGSTSASLSPSARGPFVLLAHLRQGTVSVCVGDHVDVGDRVGECGNSGNSVQPHVHVQATDSLDWPAARGLPIRFRAADGAGVMPEESEVFFVP